MVAVAVLVAIGISVGADAFGLRSRGFFQPCPLALLRLKTPGSKAQDPRDSRNHRLRDPYIFVIMWASRFSLAHDCLEPPSSALVQSYRIAADW